MRLLEWDSVPVVDVITIYKRKFYPFLKKVNPSYVLKGIRLFKSYIFCEFYNLITENLVSLTDYVKNNLRNMHLGLYYKKANLLKGCYKIYHYFQSGTLADKAFGELADSKCKTYHLNQCPFINRKLSREESLQFFKQMNLIRHFESTCVHLYQNKHIHGFCHLYTGQEACAVGIRSVMRLQDTAITSYRCHGWALLMSEKVDEGLILILKELVGTKTGLYFFLI